MSFCLERAVECLPSLFLARRKRFARVRGACSLGTKTFARQATPACFLLLLRHCAPQVINQLLLGTDWGELEYLIIDMPPGTGTFSYPPEVVCNSRVSVGLS